MPGLRITDFGILPPKLTSSLDHRLQLPRKEGSRHKHCTPVAKAISRGGKLGAQRAPFRWCRKHASLTVPRTENLLSVPRMLRLCMPSVEFAHGTLLLAWVSFENSWAPIKCQSGLCTSLVGYTRWHPAATGSADCEGSFRGREERHMKEEEGVLIYFATHIHP